MRLIVLTENPSLLLALGSIRPDWEIATANSPSELAHVAARAAVGLMDLGTTQRGLDQVERMKEAGVTLPWVLVGDTPAPDEAKVTSVLRPFILGNLAEELERSAGVTSIPAPIRYPLSEIVPEGDDSPRLLRRMKAWASDKKPEPKEPAPHKVATAPRTIEQSKPMEKAAETPAPPPTKPQPRWKVVEPGQWKSEPKAEVWAPERSDIPVLEIREVTRPQEVEMIPEPPARHEEIVAGSEAGVVAAEHDPPTKSGYLPAPSPTEEGLILPSRRGFRERFSRKPRTDQDNEGKAAYGLGPSGYPAPPPAPLSQETPRISRPLRRGNGHVPAVEPEGDSIQDMIHSASGAAAALEGLLQQMPRLDDPSLIGNVIVAEVVETLSPDIVALYAASANGTYILIASYGLTKTEERIIVPGDHPFFREIASLRQAVMVSPVDLVQGLVAGIAGARTEAFMAAPFIASGKTVAILVVGGDLTIRDLDRLMPITSDGTEGLALSLKLATFARQAIQRGA